MKPIHAEAQGRRGAKTYWHLEGRRRVPSEYEVATSRLHYYVARGGFEVAVPMQAWYDRYQKGSPLAGADWERFADPRETTYTKYTRLQSRKEIFLDGVFESIEATGYDARLAPAWLDALELTLAPLRYPAHAFQMVAAYVGQMAPASRVTIAAALEAADEVRRIQRIAYRMAQLRLVRPDFGARAREVWERDERWQPLREAVERLLVTYDWGEAFVALNLCLKPAVDDLFMVRFAAAARERGDYQLAEVLGSLDEDCRWHRAWSAALVAVAVEDRPENRAVVDTWVGAWAPIAERAVGALEEVVCREP